MKNLLISLTMVALFAIPATASAELCRNQANGRFAKCGTPGSVLASQYKTKKASAPAMKAAAPAMKPAMKPAAAPAMKPAVAAKCKDAKGKFIKCPAAPAMKPAMKPAAKM